jgi:hypothetical protein
MNAITMNAQVRHDIGSWNQIFSGVATAGVVINSFLFCFVGSQASPRCDCVIRIGAVAEIPLRFCPFHLRFFSRNRSCLFVGSQMAAILGIADSAITAPERLREWCGGRAASLFVAAAVTEICLCGNCSCPQFLRRPLWRPP